MGIKYSGRLSVPPPLPHFKVHVSSLAHARRTKRHASTIQHLVRNVKFTHRHPPRRKGSPTTRLLSFFHLRSYSLAVAGCIKPHARRVLARCSAFSLLCHRLRPKKRC